MEDMKLRTLLLILSILGLALPCSAQIHWNDSTSGDWGGDDIGVNPNPSNPTGEVTEVTMSKTILLLDGGGRARISANVNRDAANKKISWTSSDEAIAIVDDRGYVTALKKGTATVTATAVSNGKSASCNVTVKSDYSERLYGWAMQPATSTPWKGRLWYDKYSNYTEPSKDSKGRMWYEDGYNDSGWETFTAPLGTVNNYNTFQQYGSPQYIRTSFQIISKKNKRFYFYYSFDGYGPVYINGHNVYQVPGCQSGYVEIDPELLKEGDNTLCTRFSRGGASWMDMGIYYINDVATTDIYLDRYNMTMAPGELYKFKATVLPVNATSEDLLWTVSDPSILFVTQSGRLMALKPGKATVTATATDGSGISRSCEVTVRNEDLQIAKRDTVYIKYADETWRVRTFYCQIGDTPEHDSKGREWTAPDYDDTSWSWRNGCIGAYGDCVTQWRTEGDSYLVRIPFYVWDKKRVQYILTTSLSDHHEHWGEVWLNGELYSENTNLDRMNKGLLSADKLNEGYNILAIRVNNNYGEGHLDFNLLYERLEAITSIDIPSSISLEQGEFKRISVTRHPNTATEKILLWQVADPSIAHVSPSGQITGLKAGTTTITVYSQNNPTVRATATVNVSSSTHDWGYSGWLLVKGRELPWTTQAMPVEWSGHAPNDANGRKWTELNYDDSSWGYLYGPAGKRWPGDWVDDPDMPTVWWGDAYCMRHKFYLPDMKGYDFNIYTPRWDYVNLYLNGHKVQGEEIPLEYLNLNGENILAGYYGGWWDGMVDFGIHYERSIPVTRIILSEKQLTLPQCTTHRLTATVKPNEVTRPNLTWKSSDERVARVNSDGTVLTICPGKAVISACATDGSGIVGTCQVTVTEEFGTEENLPLLPRGSVLLSCVGENYNTLPKDEAGNDCTNMDFDDSQWKPAQLAMVYQYGDEYNGETYYFRHKFYMPDVRGKYVLRMDSWFTGRSKFWINGVLIGEIHEHEGHQRDIPAELLNYGGENILTVSRQADGQFIFDCWMDLIKIVPVESITLSLTSLTLDQEQQVRLEAYVGPDNAYNREVKWTSDNPTIASVDDWGNVTGMGEGVTNITAAAVDGSGVKATCHVTVTRYINIDGQRVEVKPVTAVTLDKVSVTLKQNQRDKLTATITPSDAYYKEVKWTTSNPDVVTVDQEGNIRAGIAGKATVTVTNTHGKAYSATCQVTVTDEVMPLQPGDWVLPNGDEGSWNARVIYATWGHPYHDVEPSADAAGKPWTALDYDDSNWQQKQGPFYRGNGNWPDDDSRYYVRRKFVVGDLSNINSIRLWVNHDDRATIYLNGILVADCPYAHSCEYLLSKELLLPGENIICANVYQGGGDAYIDMGLVGAAEEVKIAKELYFENTDIFLNLGETIRLPLIVRPDDVYNRTFMWESSDNTVAAVSESGDVTGLTIGSATITARTTDGSNLTATCQVKVADMTYVEAWVKPLGRDESWSAKYKYCRLGETLYDKGPSDDSKGVSWTSPQYDDASWENIIGPIGHEVGDHYETFWPDNDSRYYLREKFTLTDLPMCSYLRLLVRHDDGVRIWINGRLVRDTEESIMDDWLDIPQATLVEGINTICIEVSEGFGGAYIDYGIWALRRVEVKHVTGVTLDKDSVTLKQRQRIRLTATVMPDDATYKEVRWETSDPDVATVDWEGNVRAHAAGTATITATNTHGEAYSATCLVTVTDEVAPLVPGDWVLPTGEEHPWDARVIYAPWGHANHDVEPANDANGNKWTSLNYDDNDWQAISGPLNRDYGNWPDEDSRYYVRRTFTIGDLSGINSVKLYIKHDDNALVYINGTFVAECPDWSGGEYREYLLSKKLLPEGQNIVCVNIYQGGGGADLDFGLMGSDETGPAVVDKLSFSTEEYTMQVGRRRTLTVRREPEGALCTELTWKSSNPAVATVDNNGRVEALTVGTTNISVTATIGNNTLSASCTLTVTEKTATTGALPDVPFEFNYNAFDYDDQEHLIANHPDANLADYNLRLTDNLPTFDEAEGSLDIQAHCCGWIDRWEFESWDSGDYFYRQGQDDMTIICKVAPNLYNSCDFISNRAGGYNYMFRIGDRSSFYLHTDYPYNPDRSIRLSSSEEQILAVRVNGKEDYILLENLTTGESRCVNDVCWGGSGNAFKFFYNDGGEFYTGKFFWVYYSKELLDDDDLERVSHYNDQVVPGLDDRIDMVTPDGIDAEYYDLLGNKVNTPKPNTIVIRRFCNGRSDKVLVK